MRSNDVLREWLGAGAGFDASRCESPIEKMLLAGLSYQVARYDSTHMHARMQLTVTPQKVFGERRVDFFLECGGGELVVECDGHEFHERTKEQAASDKARDRWFTQEGYRVIRFTGSEIWANPFTCAQQAIEIVAGDFLADRASRTARACIEKMKQFLADGDERTAA